MRVRAVTCAVVGASFVVLCFGPTIQAGQAQELVQHREGKDVDNGPRALGLVQIKDKGKARLIPIAIMMNGKFYDAESYKADPVPMALDFGVIYEGFSAGVSQGLFTITQPGQLNREWIAEGTWLPEGAKPKTDRKKYTPPVIDEGGGRDDDRPVLHRRAGGEADKDDGKPAAGSGAASPSPSSSAGSAGGSSPSAASSAPASGQSPADKTSASASGKPAESAANKPSDAGAAKAPDSAKPTESASSRTSEYEQPLNDPNRPILRRGKPDPNARHEPFVNFDDADELAAATKQAGKEADAAKAAAAASVKTVIAISDAKGPDPRPYTYDLKPAEEATYRREMLDLAAQQLNAKAQTGAQSSPANSQVKGSKSATGKASERKKTARPEKPDFEDVNLRIFDLSNSNEPVLVLSARTPVPPASASGSQVPEEITLIARTNLEGELRKLFFQRTDSRHLDLRPRMELIDAVDADGDGRGELLFRRTFDSGSAYAIYRVSADQLWPLWEPTP